MVDETLNETFRSTGNEIRMGVEVDRYGKPVAYHVLTKHPGDYTWASPLTTKKYVRISADRMVHVFIKRRPGQTRGEPPLAPVMNDIKLLSGYREAEITHRRIAASKMGFYTRDDKSGPVDDLSDDIEDDGSLVQEVEPGRFEVLPQGYGFQSFDTDAASTDYADFETQIFRSIAAGLGPSYFDIAMDMSDASYSAARQGLISEREFYRVMQAFFIDRFMAPIYRRWLETNMGGVNDLMSTIPTYRFDKFAGASRFVARGWPWVDPAKDIAAAEAAVELGITSRQRIVAERGEDYDEIQDELGEEGPVDSGATSE